MIAEDGWWHEFFQVFRLFAMISGRRTNEQARYIIKKLGLTTGSKFLDCPCGIGRISLPLARTGIRVTGVDITSSYLEELRRKAARARLQIALYEKDMRRINFRNEFDAAGNIWTSLGYFEKESDNRLVLKKFFQALKPGGKFVLHLINRDWLIANFQARDWFELGGAMIFQERFLDYSQSIMHDTWHFLQGEIKKTVHSKLRVYSYHELIGMFTSVGFMNIEGYGSIKDEPITAGHRMMFVFGQKPRQ